MTWATPWIQKLKAGETIKFRPRGSSMKPKIEDGALVTVAPLASVDVVTVGDVVMCKVNGRPHLHLVGAIKGAQYRIENNHGHVNGWTGRAQIFGRVTKVEP